jgi:arylsulfatase A-like enzyme
MATKTSRRSHPNILLILADQHRAQAFAHEGDPNVRTTNFDLMAQEGSRFTECFSVSPLGGVFQASLQTGLYFYQHGEHTQQTPVNQRCKSLADHFNQAGYNTCFIGKCMWAGDDKPGYVPPHQRLRWKHWFGHNRGHYYYDWPLFNEKGERTHEVKGLYEPTAQTNCALDWINQHGDEKPWLMQLNWGPPHPETQEDWTGSPEFKQAMVELNEALKFGRDSEILLKPSRINYESYFPQHLTGQHCPDEFLDMYDPDQLILDGSVDPDDGQVARYHLKDYYALISSIDYELGRIMTYLREHDLARDTLLIYTSDHGDFAGSHKVGRGKAAPFQQVCRVPLMVWGAGVGAGEQFDAPVSSIDLLPSLLDLARLPPDHSLPGVSQAPWLLNGKGPRQRDLLMTLPGWRALYDGQFLYAITQQYDVWKSIHLIDTHSDPLDLVNLAHIPDYKKDRHRMETRLAQRLINAGDPDFLKL